MGGVMLPHLFHTHSQRQEKPFKAGRAVLGACLELNTTLGSKVNKSDSLLLILAPAAVLGGGRELLSWNYQGTAPGKPGAGRTE